MTLARRLDLAAAAEAVMATGGDARIVLNRDTGLNRYLAAPRPRKMLSFSSSTASDITPDAFAHVCQLLDGEPVSYSARLDALRERIGAVYGLPDGCDIAFAASGTDLEYVALAAAIGRASGGVHNILLGAHEVGSGCILSAHGKYYAECTPRDVDVEPGMRIDGFGDVSLAEIALRHADGTPLTSAEMAERIAAEVACAQAEDRHALVHLLHGSKTGLVLPAIAELAGLVEAHGENATFAVDACQARLGEGVVNQYLALGCMVLVTGSKFIGGPPFSGFAICPPGLAEHSASVPRGLRNVFRRAEWPAAWDGAAILPDEANTGLALRLEAAMFELERYSALDPDLRDAIIMRFEPAVREHVLVPLGLERVPMGNEAPAQSSPLCTLATLDLASRDLDCSFTQASTLQRQLMQEGIRLGQPVRCRRLDNGEWSGNLRVSLSMPQIVALAEADSDAVECALSAELGHVAEALNRLA